MALIKTIPDPDGPGTIEAYAKLARLGIDTFSKVIEVDVAVYRSKEARDAVAEGGGPLYGPVKVDSYRVTGVPAGPGDPTYDAFFAADAANPNGIGAQVYGFLKAFTSWAGSEDA